MITAADIQMIRDNDPGAVLPGIDTMTGNPYAASSLLRLTKITQNSQAPYYYSPSKNEVIVTQNGAVLSGINFGDATVMIYANNVTIKDCTFTGTTGYWALSQPGVFSGATVENCTFQGSKSPTEGDVPIVSNEAITIEGNSFLNSPGDAVDIHGGVVTGNYFSGAGYRPGAHADAIWVDPSTVPTTITDNFIDATQNADAPGVANSAVRLSDEFGNLDDVTVSGNYLLGGGYTVQVGSTSATYTISNVSITNNEIGFGRTPLLSQSHGRGDCDWEYDRGLLESRRFDPSPRGLSGCWPSDGECGLWDQRRGRRHRVGADDALGQRLCFGASGRRHR